MKYLKVYPVIYLENRKRKIDLEHVQLTNTYSYEHVQLMNIRLFFIGERLKDMSQKSVNIILQKTSVYFTHLLTHSLRDTENISHRKIYIYLFSTNLI